MKFRLRLHSMKISSGRLRNATLTTVKYNRYHDRPIVVRLCSGYQFKPSLGQTNVSLIPSPHSNPAASPGCHKNIKRVPWFLSHRNMSRKLVQESVSISKHTLWLIAQCIYVLRPPGSPVQNETGALQNSRRTRGGGGSNK